MKLITDQKSRFGQELAVPFLGTINVDENGEIPFHETQLEQVEQLVELELGYHLIYDDVDPGQEEELGSQTEDDELGKDDSGSSIKPQTEENSPLNSTETTVENTDPKDPGTPEVVTDPGKLLKEGEEPVDENSEEGNPEKGGEDEENLLDEKAKQDIINSLEDMDFGDLKDFAADNQFPEDEWSQKRNGPQLKSYLIQKIQSL